MKALTGIMSGRRPIGILPTGRFRAREMAAKRTEAARCELRQTEAVTSMLGAVLREVGAALDGVDVAFCAFDDQDRALAWNEQFLEFFPEHAGHVTVGEPYGENLRRFYTARLSADELPLVDRYIQEGVERHRTQRRPYEFDHRGNRLRVSSVELGALGRVRVWRKVREVDGNELGVPSPLRTEFDPNASLVLERIADGVLVVDTADQCVWANRSFLMLYGFTSAQDALGLRFEEIYKGAWSGQESSRLFQLCLDTLKENQRFSGAPYELVLPGDRWVRVVEQRGDTLDGRGYFVHVDITALKRQQRALREAQDAARENEASYRLLAEFSSDVTVALSDGVVVYVSPAVRELFGWEPEQVVGKTLESFCHPDDVSGVAAAVKKLVDAPATDYRARAVRADGSYVWVEARARMTKPRSPGETPMLVINVRDIAARKATEDELAGALARLESMAATDGLTGVANRRRFDEALTSEFRRARRDGSPLALLLVDLDLFKTVNDTYGHQVGDDVLRTVAGALAKLTRRAGDLVARYGGEEFVFLLPNTSADCALKVAERVQNCVRVLDPTAMGMQSKTRLTVSIGVSNSQAMPGDGTEHDLVRLADDALFVAKRDGRNRAVAAW